MTTKLAIFRGITTPASALQEQIANFGWETTKVKWDRGLGAYIAEARNQYGEKIKKTGPDDRTALGNLLMAISRHHHMRTAAQYKVGMWKSHWADKMKPIAEAYAQAPAYDPKAAIAFKELGDDSLRRLRTLQHHLKIEPTDDPHPYEDAQEMSKDIHDKKHLFVTRAGVEHPLWSHDQAMAFRAVHDVLGHAVSGGGFDWHGSNLAATAHMPLLTPTAQQALFSEVIGQNAYASHYRHHGPQKIALFPEFTDPHQQKENPPAHTGIHPSQALPPTRTPGGAPVLGSTGYLKKYANSLMDPNAGWSSGFEPMQTVTHGVGNAYLDHGDPLESHAVMDNAALIDTKWHSLKKGDGSFDRERASLAIVNAFRVVLLSPRKDLRWNAVHYQDISHIPATTDDPKQYWDALESRRRSWNKAQGIDENAHMIYFKFLKPFRSIIQQLNPNLSFDEAKDKAERTLYSWWSEEQQRIEEEDEKKPADKQKSADEIERRANEALARRLKTYIDDKRNVKTDADAVAHEPMSLFGAAGQYNLMTGEEASKYGAFMGTHLKSISQISQHADEILEAALADVKEHDATGHHFRAKVLSLNISGVGPKVCSFAWLLLQPLTSQLATIDTHMMDVLGHHYEKEMNNRDYFKFERELAAGRDASGYGHVPLGTFQWGMWDHKRTGAGSHQDHSAMRVLDPVPHQNIDWASKAHNLKGESWLQQAPDWWKNTQDARDAVARDWHENVAKNVPQGSIPYQGQLPTTSNVKVAGGESKDEFHVGISIPEDIVLRLSEIAKELNLKDPDDAEDYHVTAFWSEHGYEDKTLHEWIRRSSMPGLRFENARIDCFPSHKGDWAIVLRFDAPEAKVLVTQLMDEAEDRGLDIKRFDGGWKPHITLGFQDEKVKARKYPDVSFRSGPLYVSIPRPLRKTADGGFGATINPSATRMQTAQKLFPGASPPEIWAKLQEESLISDTST
jgi:hypothetical protein